MTMSDDPLTPWFAAVRQAHAMPDVDVALEHKLLQEMREIPARQRRRRIALAIALGVAIFSVTGGVHAAGGFRAVRNWFSDVRSMDILQGPEGGRPRVLLRDEAGDVIGQGHLGPPDENGDYSARIFVDD